MKPIIVGNWKMNTTQDEATELIKSMRYDLEEIESVGAAVCPPFIWLTLVKQLLEGSDVKIGAQNMYFQEKGAFTGEISPVMLAEICDYVIVGHSERRQYFSEDDNLINKKMHSSLRHGLTPILCVGEHLSQHEKGETGSFIGQQLSNALEGLEKPDLIIAYEPIWAIGTGRAASGKQANDIMSLIRDIIAQKFGASKAVEVPLLYGGSVTADNILEFVCQPEINGALVGGASLKVAQFVSIVRHTAEIL